MEFRDKILAGLTNAGEEIDEYLEEAESKLDFRRHGHVLFEVLIAGNILGEITAYF